MIADSTGEREELDRVRAAYARRLTFVPPERYARTNPSQLYTLHELECAFISLLRSAGIRTFAGKRVLDVGCGAGKMLRQLLEYGGDPERLIGVDLLPDKLSEGRRLGPQIKSVCASASRLPFQDASFDVLFQFLLFTSILNPSVKQQIANEIRRTLVPGGYLIWYDFAFDNPRNPDVKGVRRSEIRRLFPGFEMVARKVTVAPPLGRCLAHLGPTAYHLVAQLRFVCTHHLCLLRKKLL